MKRILVFLFFNFIVLYYSQNRTDDYKQLLDSAIAIKKNSIEKNVKNKNYYIINADNSKYSISNKILEENIKSIDIYDKENKFLIKKGINVWKVIPILNKDQLTIDIIDFSVFYKNNNYQFLNNGGSKVIFKYSCIEEKWLLIKESHSGI